MGIGSRDWSLGRLERRMRRERPRLDSKERERLVRMVQAEPRRTMRPVLALVSVGVVGATIAAFGSVSYAVQTVNHAVGNNSASQGSKVTGGKSDSSSS